MRFEPHDYQRRAIDFVMEHTRCALFLEMGLGKTVSTLSAVNMLIENCLVERVLVIAPKKVAESTWDTEVEKWDHLRWMPVSLVTGCVRQREKALSADARIYVMGRDSVAWLDEYLRAKKCDRFDMVVIDELTSFKNSRSIRFKALRRILQSVERVVGLTGTPAPQGLIDLWGQMYCIDGGERLGRYITHYRERYFHCVAYNNIVIKTIPKKGANDEIMEKIRDITLTMRAEDWITLPPIIITDVPVRLSAKKLNDYHKFERDRVMEITGGDTSKSITAESAGALINKLMQYANGAIYTESHEVCTIHTEKVLRLCEILASEDSPLLCFYWYKHDLDAILKGIPETVRCRVYDNKKDMEDWNNGEIDLLLAHPLSTSYGLNMQKGGSRIVWYAPVWNLELYQQANARLHRQGQELPVRVFNLISLGTVDERLAEALRGKNDTQANILKQLATGIINNVK